MREPVLSPHRCLVHGAPWAGCARHRVMELAPFEECPECWVERTGGSDLVRADVLERPPVGIASYRLPEQELPRPVHLVTRRYRVEQVPWHLSDGSRGLAPIWVRVE